jgi:phenylacetate-CoA ligase
MLLRVERGINASGTEDPQVKRAVELGIKKQLLVSCDVEIVGYGALPRTEKKAKRVFDNRD